MKKKKKNKKKKTKVMSEAGEVSTLIRCLLHLFAKCSLLTLHLYICHVVDEMYVY